MRARCCIFGLAIVTQLGTQLGCKPDEPTDEGAEVPACVEYELDGCAALYPATYDQVWAQTLSVGCGPQGSACHGQDGSGGAIDGLLFVDAQASWDHMLAEGLIVPGDPLCSPLFVRLAIDDPVLRMPPGSSALAPGAMCSIGTWIADGAESVAP